jgi:hypothetical protein
VRLGGERIDPRELGGLLRTLVGTFRYRSCGGFGSGVGTRADRHLDLASTCIWNLEKT